MSPASSPSTRSKTMVRAALLALMLAVLVVGVWWINKAGLLRQALDWIRDLGSWGPVAFMAIFIGAVVLFVPTILLTIGAGFIFGLGPGIAYVLGAAVISSNIAFLISRHFARDWIAHKIETHPKFKAIDDAVAREGWKIVALIRLAPVFPFSILSYAFGLTRLPWGQYFLANFAMIPGTVMYIYFGYLARATLTDDVPGKVNTPTWVKWVIAALTVTVVLYVTRFAKRALAQKVS